VFVVCNFGSVQRAAAVLYDKGTMQEPYETRQQGGGRRIPTELWAELEARAS